jgi:hypothetical protein
MSYGPTVSHSVRADPVGDLAAGRKGRMVPQRALSGQRNVRREAPRGESPNGCCPIHATGVKLADDFKVTPLDYMDRSP